LLTPEAFFLLGLPDEDLVMRALERRDGYALAILQERQFQDRAFVLSSSTDQTADGKRTVIMVRRRIYWRKKKLRRIHRLFGRGNITS